MTVQIPEEKGRGLQESSTNTPRRLGFPGVVHALFSEESLNKDLVEVFPFWALLFSVSPLVPLVYREDVFVFLKPKVKSVKHTLITCDLSLLIEVKLRAVVRNPFLRAILWLSGDSFDSVRGVMLSKEVC